MFSSADMMRMAWSRSSTPSRGRGPLALAVAWEVAGCTYQLPCAAMRHAPEPHLAKACGSRADRLLCITAAPRTTSNGALRSAVRTPARYRGSMADPSSKDRAAFASRTGRGYVQMLGAQQEQRGPRVATPNPRAASIACCQIRGSGLRKGSVLFAPVPRQS